MDKIVPWKTFQETLDNLDKFRSDYSKEASNLMGGIKTTMMNGMDTYFGASQRIYEWCGLAVKVLPNFKKLFNGGETQAKFNAQKKILLLLLTNGIAKMTKAQEKLEACSTAFNEAAGKLDSLTRRLKADFDEKSEYYKTKISEIRKTAYQGGAPFMFLGIGIAAGVAEGKLIPDIKKKMASIEAYYNSLNGDISKTATDIDETKVKINEEIRAIGEMKTQAEEAQIYIEAEEGDGTMFTMIIESIDSLMTKATEYRERHKDDATKLKI